MESKKQIQQIGNESQKTTNYDYDIFVSYRHLSSDSKIHSASLARSITQAFQLEGFKVFFYCNNTKDAFEIIENTKSRYYIILVTQYSIDTVKNYHYKTIEEKESINESKEGDGYNFAKELYLIDKGIASNKIDKRNVFLFNIDKCFERRRDIPETFSDCGYKLLGSQKPQRTEVINFPTDEDFSIDKLINPDPDKDGEIKIEKSPRYSYERYKRLTKRILILASFTLLMLVAALGVNRQQRKNYINNLSERDSTISRKDTIINQYRNKCLVFTGGGTVQKYLLDSFKIDVNNYKYGLNYIHLPSEDAWTLLWDDFTENGEARQYWPIVLSAEKINISRHNNLNEFLKEKRIIEYEVGTVPLMIQILGDTFEPIGIDPIDLQKLIKNSSYAVHTTSEHSGTYNAYKKMFLDCGFNLDNYINKKGRNDFTLKYYNVNAGEKHVILANKYWHYEVGNIELIPIISNTKTVDTAIRLYVYTIAERKTTGSNECKLCPQVKEFLDGIGCDTAQPISFSSKELIELHKKEQQQ